MHGTARYAHMWIPSSGEMQPSGCFRVSDGPHGVSRAPLRAASLGTPMSTRLRLARREITPAPQGWVQPCVFQRYTKCTAMPATTPPASQVQNDRVPYSRRVTLTNTPHLAILNHRGWAFLE